MTIPRERTSAVQYTADFLRALTDPSQTPRVPREIRRRASMLLRHYPSRLDLSEAALGAPDTWAAPDPNPEDLALVRELRKGMAKRRVGK